MYDYYDIIENHKPIIVDGNVLELPNAWYLTKDGTLYNSMGKQAHDHSVLEYEVSDITWRRIEPSSFEDLKNKYHTLYNSIRENGYVSYEQCIQFLNIELNNNIIKNDEINHKLLLNLVLSCIAAIQAPVIMMSQNRQSEKDSLRDQNDYRTDLKSELILEELHDKIDLIMKEQKEIKKLLSERSENIVLINKDDKNEKN